MNKVVKTNKTRWLHLKEPLPVLLAYWTAEGLPEGGLTFKPDVYDWDKQTLTALKQKTRSGIAYVKPEPVQEPEPEAEAETEPKPNP